MDRGDIAFKCNFATLDESTGIVLRRRADRHFEEAGPVLCRALDGTRPFKVVGFVMTVFHVLSQTTKHARRIELFFPGSSL